MIDHLAGIHPPLADIVRNLIQILAGENIQIRVVQGLRYLAQQEELYEQGRTKPGKIVTWARPGYSWHDFGLAVDVAPFDSQGQPDWNPSHSAWERIVAVGTSLGLVAGGLWPEPKTDRPHLQRTGRFGTTPSGEVRELMESGGLQSVWDEAFKEA